MEIKVYKINNCINCDLLINNLKYAIENLKNNKDINLEICTSLTKMASKNIKEIPALEIDDVVISQGILYSKEDLLEILQNKEILKKRHFENNAICDEKGCKLNDKK